MKIATLVTGCFALSAIAAASAFAAGTDEVTFSQASGYAGGKKCAGGMEGKDESASGEKPSQHTWEKPGGGWVMAAVAPDIYKKMKGCTSEVGGKKIKIADVCPICAKNKKMDISHSECAQMNNNPTLPKPMKWECSGANSRVRKAALGTAN